MRCLFAMDGRRWEKLSPEAVRSCKLDTSNQDVVHQTIITTMMFPSGRLGFQVFHGLHEPVMIVTCMRETRR